MATPVTFYGWTFAEETTCGIDFNVEVGRTYYVWMKRNNGSLRTEFGVDESLVTRRDRDKIAEYARR